MPQFAVGTESGLFGLSEEHGAWSAGASYLSDVSITSIARDGESTVLVSSLSDGVSRVDFATGEVMRLGENVLPAGVRWVAVSPHDSQKLFAAIEPAAIWTSSDGGRNWHENASVKAIAQAKQWKYPVKTVPSHVRHILVSWDDPRYVYAAIQVGGILRSEDGGETWSCTADGFDPDIHSLFQHPTDPELLYAVAGGGGPVGEDRPNPLPLPMGRPFFRSRDRGRTWECISLDFDRTYGISMSGVPSQSATLVAGVARDQPPFWRKRPELADAVLLTSSDDGTTWQRCTDGLPQTFDTMIEAVEVDRKHGNRVLIGLGGARLRDSSGSRIVGEPEGAIYVCDDPAGRWQQLPVRFPGISTIHAL